MAATKLSAVMLLCLVFGLAYAQNKCNTAFTFKEEFMKRTYDIIIAYNISSTKNVQSCAEFIETYDGPGKDTFVIIYTEDGVKKSRPGTASFGNNKGVYFYNDNKDQKYDVYVETDPSGVFVSYACNGNEQFIWVTYENNQDLSKEADEVAKGLTDNPADYKISRDGC